MSGFMKLDRVRKRARRSLARMTLAGGAEAVNQYLQYVMSDLRRGMIMTGCDNVAEITNEILVKNTYF